MALAESAERTADGAVWNDRVRAERQLARQIGELGERGPMVLAGFSRGAELALWLALTGAIEAVGCILVAPSPNAAEFYRSAMARRVRVWMALGQEDAMYFERGVALAEALRDGGLDCRAVMVAAMGHEFPAGFGEELLPGALELVSG